MTNVIQRYLRPRIFCSSASEYHVVLRYCILRDAGASGRCCWCTLCGFSVTDVLLKYILKSVNMQHREWIYYTVKQYFWRNEMKYWNRWLDPFRPSKGASFQEHSFWLLVNTMWFWSNWLVANVGAIWQRTTTKGACLREYSVASSSK
jgi:hypothetical protein